MLIARYSSALLLIDLQERLLPAVADGAACVARCRLLLTAARRLGVPVLATEQYPQGLGTVVAELRAALADDEVLSKSRFACADEPAVRARLKRLGRRQLVLAGSEAHVCVLQSALRLRESGYTVFVVADAVASRLPARRERALARLAAAGVVVVDSEMVVFEWLSHREDAAFRDLIKLIRDNPGGSDGRAVPAPRP